LFPVAIRYYLADLIGSSDCLILLRARMGEMATSGYGLVIPKTPADVKN
jgi:hypothetical protein